MGIHNMGIQEYGDFTIGEILDILDETHEIQYGREVRTDSNDTQVITDVEAIEAFLKS